MPVIPAAELSILGTQTRCRNAYTRPRFASSRWHRLFAIPQQRQRGAAVIESALAILLLLLVATAVIEFSHWGVVRHLCRQALHDSLRISVSEHGTLQSLEQAFETLRHSRLTQAWSLQITRPDAETLTDFQDPFLSAQQGLPVIRNDSQREQHQRFLTRWPDGKGPISGKTIFEANLLTVELTYHHQLLSPWFRRWLGAATTRLSLQAAMQTDFHKSRAIPNHMQRIDKIDRTPHPMVTEQPLSIKGQEINPKSHREQYSIRPPYAPKTFNETKALTDINTPTEVKAPMPSTSDATAIPLHPDLAEQCGVLMCCVDPG